MKKQNGFTFFLLTIAAIITMAFTSSCTSNSEKKTNINVTETTTVDEMIVLSYATNDLDWNKEESFVLKTTYETGKGDVPGNVLMSLGKSKNSKSIKDTGTGVGISPKTISAILKQITDRKKEGLNRAEGSETDADGEIVKYEYANFDSGKTIFIISKQGVDQFTYYGRKESADALITQINLRANRYLI